MIDKAALEKLQAYRNDGSYEKELLSLLEAEIARGDAPTAKPAHVCDENCGWAINARHCAAQSDGFEKFVEMLDREPQYKPRLAELLSHSNSSSKPVLWAEKDEYGDYVTDGLWREKESAEAKGIKVFPLYGQPHASRDLKSLISECEAYVYEQFRTVTDRDTDTAGDAAELVVKYLAASGHLGIQGDWRPIETAPKYTDVLVYRADAGVWIARYDSNCHFIRDDDSCDPDHEAWISVEGFHEYDEAPTHWMPLPAAPRDAG